MRKVIALLLALMLVLSMVIPAYAVTPKLEIPSLPKVPEIKVEVKLSENFWDNWFASHPLKINWSK